jgi:hypothetical protein
MKNCSFASSRYLVIRRTAGLLLKTANPEKAEYPAMLNLGWGCGYG